MTKTTVWHIFIGYRARQHLMLSSAIFWHECFNHEWLYTNINWCTRIWAHSVSFSAATTVKRSDSVESFICMNYTSSVRACLFMRAACLTHAYTHTATPFSTVIGSSPEASAPSALWDMSRCFQPCTFFSSFWISAFISPFFLLGLHHCSLLCVIAAQEQHPTSSFYISASSIFFSVHPSQGDSPHSRLFLSLPPSASVSHSILVTLPITRTSVRSLWLLTSILSHHQSNCCLLQHPSLSIDWPGSNDPVVALSTEPPSGVPHPHHSAFHSNPLYLSVQSSGKPQLENGNFHSPHMHWHTLLLSSSSSSSSLSRSGQRCVWFPPSAI